MVADLIAEDAEGHLVLIGEIKTNQLNPGLLAKFIVYLSENAPHARFIMIADADLIRFWSRDDLDPTRPLLALNTGEILSHYDLRGRRTGFEGFYMATLIDSWLDDLNTRWKHENPPGSSEMERIGLAPLLAGGITRKEVALGSDAVC